MKHPLCKSELIVFAEQIFCGKKALKDFNFLERENFERLRVIVNRGVKSLKEKDFLENSDVKFLCFESLHLKLAIFPLSLILKEEELVQRKCMEGLIRNFSLKDLGYFFSLFEGYVYNFLVRTASANLLEELEYSLQKVKQGQRCVLSQEISVSRISIFLAVFLNECHEASLSVKDYTEDYLGKFEEEMKAYAYHFLQEIGIEQKLENFTKRQWLFLSGLTPRELMNFLGVILKNTLFQKLLEPLSKEQKSDILESLANNQGTCIFRSLDKTQKLLKSIRSFVAIVEKVCSSSKEEERVVSI
jgi:hypothetical protein